MNIKEDFFSFNGRIRRSTYFIRIVALFILLIILSFFIGVIGAVLNSGNLYFTEIFFILLVIIYLIAYIVQDVKRLHDLDSSGIWIILRFIPIISLIFSFYLLLADGTVGPNQYGEDPKGRTPQNPQYTSNQEDETRYQWK